MDLKSLQIIFDLVFVAITFLFFTVDTIKILQWNCRNIHTNLDQFNQFLDKNQSDIICLQSVNRKASDLPFFEGFYYPPYYKTNENQKVSIATYIRSNITVRHMPCLSQDNFQVVIEILLDNSRLE